MKKLKKIKNYVFKWFTFWEFIKYTIIKVQRHERHNLESFQKQLLVIITVEVWINEID